MPGVTNDWSTRILNLTNGKAPLNATALQTPIDGTNPIEIALFETGSGPTDAGGGTELSGSGYARVDTQASDWNSATNGLTDNATVITFPVATADWNSAGHVGRFAPTVGGNADLNGQLIDYGDLTVPKTVTSGDTAEFAAGELDINYNGNN